MLWRSKGRLISAAIIIFWLVMIALFLRREGILPYLSAAHRPLSPRIMHPTDTWMGIFFGGAQIGFVNTNTTPDSRDGKIGTALSVTAKIHLTLLSSPTEIYLAGSAWIPQDSGIAQFDFKVRSSDHTMSVAATVEDGILNAEIHTAGEVIPLKFPVGKDLLLSGAMGTTTLNVPDLKKDEEVFIDTFDPMTFSMGKTRIKCVGEETLDVTGQQIPTKILTTTLNGLTSKVWIAANEEVVQAETPFGFSLRKVRPQEAFFRTEAQEPQDLLNVIGVQPTGQKPFRGATRMTIRLTGIVPENYPPVDTTQTAAENVYTITMAQAPAEQEVKPGDEQAEYLKADAFAQADHPKIQQVADNAAGSETGRWTRALAIYQWVYDTIEKTVVFSIPSALEVLETLEGDCNEHTILYTALARAAGVPTRIAIGLTWSDELNGFYYHAWPEVYAGQWIWMDPTLGQPIADATHIKLFNGSIETWPQLIPFLGQLKIEVIAIE